MIKKTNISLLGLVIGIVSLFSLPLFVGTADADHLRDWGLKMDNTSARFKELRKFDYDAVVDKESQLVWDRYPSVDPLNWHAAWTKCFNLEIGGRKGYRLPAAEEITTLVDTNKKGPALPEGHPFGNIYDPEQFGYRQYWTATTSNFDPNLAWFFDVGTGEVNIAIKSSYYNVWCVRGQHGHDGM